MRKLKLQVQMSIDGFISGPNGEMDWMVWNWDDEINALKAEPGKDIIAYGGGTFVSSLIKAGLIDEYHLFINPVALGTGMAIFKESDRKQKFVLKNSLAFTCGISLLRYEPAHSNNLIS